MSTGCATIFTSSSADIEVDSDPEGASVYVDGLQRDGKTPAEITLEHSYSSPWQEEEVVLKLEGYEDRAFEVDHGIAGWYWANFLLGPFAGVGGLIDLFSGSWAKVDRESFSVELRQETAELKKKMSEKYDYYSLGELDRNESGSYILPEEEKFIVHDRESEKLILFK